jgi:hypothetical protein
MSPFSSTTDGGLISPSGLSISLIFQNVQRESALIFKIRKFNFFGRDIGFDKLLDRLEPSQFAQAFLPYLPISSCLAFEFALTKQWSPPLIQSLLFLRKRVSAGSFFGHW